MSSYNNVDTSAMSPLENKHFNMKQFIECVREFLQTRADDIANVLNRHLQLLSVTIDISTFDPHTSVVAEFFVSLHELLSNLEPRSSLSWCCVNVLGTACKNPSARKALIQTYQFLPPLSKMLGDHLISEKKIRLLTLMQELTCGIKISWQIPHLPHLMATLTRWIEQGEEEAEIITLSLGVLVNICYKNLPAIYTLTRCTDIKKFMKICMPLQGIKVEVHVCKLLIILDYMNGKVPDGALIKLIEVTFKSIVEAFKARDAMLLRHIVEFFLDIRSQNTHMDALVNYKNYDLEFEKLLAVIESREKAQTGDNIPHDPECMSLLFEFLHSLIELHILTLERLYPRLISVALKWIQKDLVCMQALNILRTIAINTNSDSIAVLEPLLDGLPMFLLALEIAEEIPTHSEYNKRLSALMQLLRALVQAGHTRYRVLDTIREDQVQKIFIPLLGHNSPRTRASDADTYSTEAVNLYVNALALVDELAKHDLKWVNLHSQLLQHKQIHMILAQALFGSGKDTKCLVLGLSATPLFPSSNVAAAMEELQAMVQIESNSSVSTNQPIEESLCFPVLSITQIQRLDEVIAKLKEFCDDNKFHNITTSDVMELYEYKMAAMGHAERAALANVEAASQRCTHLQHRTAQLTAELSRLHQLLFHSQQCHEQAVKTRDELSENNRDLITRLDAEKGRLKVTSSQLALKEKVLTETEQLLEETCRKLKEVDAIRQTYEEQNADFKKVINKLEENLLRKEKLVEKKEELLSRTSANNEALKTQVTAFEKQVRQLEAKVQTTHYELSEVTKDLANRKQIIETITKLASSHTYNK